VAFTERAVGLHQRTHGAAARESASVDSRDGADEVELALDRPDLVVRLRREHPRRVADGDPADRQLRAGGKGAVDVQHTIDADLRACAEARAREEGRAGGDERLVADLRAVDVRMRTDQDALADACRVAGAPAHHGVLHHDAAFAKLHRAIFGRQDGAEQDAALRGHVDVAAEHGVRRHVRARMDARPRPVVRDQHARSVTENAASPGARGRRGSSM